MQYGWCPYKKRKRHQGCVHTEKSHVKTHSQKAAVCKPRRESSGETLFLEFLPQELWEKKIPQTQPVVFYYGSQSRLTQTTTCVYWCSGVRMGSEDSESGTLRSQNVTGSESSWKLRSFISSRVKGSFLEWYCQEQNRKEQIISSFCTPVTL